MKKLIFAAIAAVAGNLYAQTTIPNLGSMGTVDPTADVLHIIDSSALDPKDRKITVNALSDAFWSLTDRANALTWGDGLNASNIWTFDVAGTDPTITFGNGSVSVAATIAVADIWSTGASALTLRGKRPRH